MESYCMARLDSDPMYEVDQSEGPGGVFDDLIGMEANDSPIDGFMHSTKDLSLFLQVTLSYSPDSLCEPSRTNR